MFGVGIGELIIIFAIVFLLFGARRVPEIATSLGQAINNFRVALRGGTEEEQKLQLAEKNQSQTIEPPTKS